MEELGAKYKGDLDEMMQEDYGTVGMKKEDMEKLFNNGVKRPAPAPATTPVQREQPEALVQTPEQAEAPELRRRAASLFEPPAKAEEEAEAKANPNPYKVGSMEWYKEDKRLKHLAKLRSEGKTIQCTRCKKHKSDFDNRPVCGDCQKLSKSSNHSARAAKHHQNQQRAVPGTTPAATPAQAAAAAASAARAGKEGEAWRKERAAAVLTTTAPARAPAPAPTPAQEQHVQEQKQESDSSSAESRLIQEYQKVLDLDEETIRTIIAASDSAKKRSTAAVSTTPGVARVNPHYRNWHLPTPS